MDFIKEYVSVLALITGGLAGAVLTAIVSYVRRDKVILGRSIIRRTIITEKGPDFSISFRGQVVQRLDQQEVVLRNIGNKVIENISITIEVSGDILEKKLEKPEGSTFSFESNQNNEKQLLLNCDYINKGDVITIQITEADSNKKEARVIARAKNLVVKSFDPYKTPMNIISRIVTVMSALPLFILLGITVKNGDILMGLGVIVIGLLAYLILFGYAVISKWLLRN